MATSRLDILINAQNKASGELSKVDNQLSGLSGAAGAATKALGALGIAFGAQQIGRFAVDAAMAADSAGRLRTSFVGLADEAGQSADEMLAAMKKASLGMISESDLMLSANKAMMLGVADSADEMSRLLEVAAERGQAMGLSTSQAFNDIVTGIGRQSAMILDNLGIVIDVEEAYEDYAKQLNKTTDALSDTEKKQAFLNAALAESDGSVDVAIDSYAQLSVAIGELKIAIGELIDEPLGGFVSEMATELSDLAILMDAAGEGPRSFMSAYNEMWDREKLRNDEAIMGLEDYDAALMRSRESLGALGQAAQDAAETTQQSWGQLLFGSDEMQEVLSADTLAEAKADEAGRVWSAAFNASVAEGVSWEAAIGNADAMLRNATMQIDGLASSLKAAGVPANQVEEAIGALVDQIIESIRAMSEAGSAGQTAGAKIEAGMMRGSFAAAQLVSALKAAGSAFAAFGSEVTTAKGRFEEGFGAGTVTKLGTINDALAESAELSVEIGKAYGGGGPIASGINELSSLASKIQGVFGIGSVAGVNAEDLLPREDAVNENARRLADIAVNGFKGQDWMGEFAAEAPNIFAALSESGDPQGTAAQLLKDFQDGLLNGTDELIDREAAKEKVRRMIMGEQSTAELAQSIASELQAEMGIAMGEAQAAAASVLGGGNAGTGEAIIAEVRAAEVRIKNAGGDAGKQWGNMFLATVQEGVPGELVAMLANLVTPFVQSSLTAQESRGGAASATP